MFLFEASGLSLFNSFKQVKHMCVVHLIIIHSDNGLLPGLRQAIIWNNAGILLIRPLGTNLSETLIEIDTFSFTNMYLNMSGKCLMATMC